VSEFRSVGSSSSSISSEQSPTTTRPGGWLVSELWVDMKRILVHRNRPLDVRNVLWAVFACDGFAILVLFRTRQCFRRCRNPLPRGSRVLGKNEVGEECVPGANTVALYEIPAGKVALGVLARAAADNKNPPRVFCA
jgi:hypothetical protein